MLFENINQFNKAKNTLIESKGDIDLTFKKLKNDPSFYSISDKELYESIVKLNEGFGDRILNFLSGSLGGDISKIKTVLTQMKEQELKFNREEFEIQKEFYRTIQDEKALDKDTKNPSYDQLKKDIQRSRNALNQRFRELTKTHEEIFSALEKKIESLCEDSKRKKRFFNAQRADDVRITATDRYEKRKALTSMSTVRSKELENFFGISEEDLRKDVDKANKKVKKEEEALKNQPQEKDLKKRYEDEPEKGFYESLEKIRENVGGYYAKKKDLEELIDELDNITKEKEFDSFPSQKKNYIWEIKREANKLLSDLVKSQKTQ